MNLLISNVSSWKVIPELLLLNSLCPDMVNGDAEYKKLAKNQKTNTRLYLCSTGSSSKTFRNSHKYFL